MDYIWYGGTLGKLVAAAVGMWPSAFLFFRAVIFRFRDEGAGGRYFVDGGLMVVGGLPAAAANLY
jgi:hypothetical protein